MKIRRPKHLISVPRISITGSNGWPLDDELATRVTIKYSRPSPRVIEFCGRTDNRRIRVKKLLEGANDTSRSESDLDRMSMEVHVACEWASFDRQSLFVRQSRANRARLEVGWREAASPKKEIVHLWKALRTQNLKKIEKAVIALSPFAARLMIGAAQELAGTPLHDAGFVSGRRDYFIDSCARLAEARGRQVAKPILDARAGEPLVGIVDGELINSDFYRPERLERAVEYLVNAKKFKGRPSMPVHDHAVDIIRRALRDLTGSSAGRTTDPVTCTPKGQLHNLVLKIGGIYDIDLVSKAADDRLRSRSQNANLWGFSL